ncbi:MAG: stage III sporulation protein AG [Clostridiales bacterium]|uniref:stage III sporulation protein AG n=1 Tax=Clostridium sp. N3C TaxID=1776758 RepID=UPI00092E1E5D|nr:stage III sporulation protein AG [Clostridium sp. N3C]NLZ47365.1 stage III sporulation protein AG [Clostridiales bacterium]SCN21378.1 stage III sporulation protein AG [Clostridium sp. N3C]
MNSNKLLEYINKLMSKKNMYNLIVLFLIGILLVIVSNFFKGQPTAAVSTATDLEDTKTSSSDELQLSATEEKLKQELKSTLSKIKGIGKVDLMINFQCSEEYVPAEEKSTSTSVTNEKDNEGGERKITQDTDGTKIVVSSDGNTTKPVMLKKISPKVEGVIIVAEGAEDEQIRKDVILAVSSLFGIPNYKIQVFAMN